MKAISLIFSLAIIYAAYSTVILQSSTTTPIVSPVGAQTNVSTFYNTNYPGFVASGIAWITSRSPSNRLTFESLFYANCIGSAKIAIAASATFSAYLDGVLVATNTALQVSSFPAEISCGNHNFTIVLSGNGPLAVTFVIDQDQSNCFKCESTGFWNQNTCSCACINTIFDQGCGCTAPKVWRGYPICGCGCRRRIIRPPTFIAGIATRQGETEDDGEGEDARSSVAASLTLPFACLAPRYYSQAKCKCVCPFQYCPPKHQFDEQNCICRQLIY